jgi:hypothetical protein
MEKAILIETPGQLAGAGSFARVYYGTEFCQNKLPDLRTLKQVHKRIRSEKKNMTLVTPYVTDRGIDRLRELFDYLDQAGAPGEVVFNDWGVFRVLRDGYPNLTPVLGRLLTKQRRDPMAHDVLLNRQAPGKEIVAKNRATRIVCPKTTPPPVLEHYKASVINMRIFQEYLRENGVRRLEIDNLVWGMNISVDRKIGVSLYYPFGYVSTTRLCGLLSLTYSSCRRECGNRYISFRDPGSPVPFYIYGNTVFYKTALPSRAALQRMHINRIVYQPQFGGRDA